ncbi:MAG: hypothetical protein QOF60_974, partial [Actinomycetota bacterium]|nr:hypothetical protein [Actinomycetota bacterium]
GGGPGAAAGSDGFDGKSWVLVPLCATLLVSGLLQVDFHYRGQREALDLFEAALLPVVAVFAGPGAVMLAAVTKLASQRLLRVEPVKAAFNVAQWSCAAGVASLVFLRLRDASVDPTAALVVAMVAAIVVNHLSVVFVLALVQGRGLREVFSGLGPVVPVWVIGGAANLSFGLIFAVVVAAKPGLAALCLVPLGVLSLAHRSYSEVVVDRARVESLHAATHILAGPVGTAEALPEVLEAIRGAFSAAAVDVVLFDGDVQHHAGDPDLAGLARAIASAAAGSEVRRIDAGDGSTIGGMLAEAERRCCLVGPLRYDGRTVGVLVSTDRTGLDGFDVGERQVFEALTGEIASALQRSELHDALVRERGHLFEIVDRSSDGIFTIAADGTVADWNPAMEGITGFSAAEAVGARSTMLLRARTGEGVEVDFEDWSGAGVASLPTEFEVSTRAGETRVLACSFAGTRTEPVSLVVVARDVTRQREIDRMRDDFVATVSHELRTPLTSIIGFTSMLMEPPRPLTEKEQAESLAMVRKGARRLERLVFNLLEVSRIEARTQIAPTAPVDVDAACRDVVAEMQETYPGRQITVHPGSGALRAIGNRLSIEQILGNLVGNALKYGDGSPVTVDVDESEPDTVTLRVSDRGPGIPESEHERIFDRFHRLDHQAVQAGTGLGLYISRQLATAMGGTLTISSNGGKGATFSLTLPAELDLVAA